MEERTNSVEVEFIDGSKDYFTVPEGKGAKYYAEFEMFSVGGWWMPREMVKMIYMGDKE